MLERREDLRTVEWGQRNHGPPPHGGPVLQTPHDAGESRRVSDRPESGYRGLATERVKMARGDPAKVFDCTTVPCLADCEAGGLDDARVGVGEQREVVRHIERQRQLSDVPASRGRRVAHRSCDVVASGLSHPHECPERGSAHSWVHVVEESESSLLIALVTGDGGRAKAQRALDTLWCVQV